jgi:two-component system, cell cycle response regulator
VPVNLADTPYIIILTAMTTKESVRAGLDAGADDYLTKPFDAGELLARIGVGRRMVELHRQIETKNRLLEELAHTDALTGLPNRRAIEQWAQRQLRGAARHGFPLWVILADLDSFKKVNDTYGHEAGDVVLRRFAEVLKSHTRESDICGRIGGDEFLLVITHVNKEQIQIAAERMRKQFVDSAFSFACGKEVIGASFGISGFHGKEAPAFQTLVQQADRALYCAKRAGRNQLQMAG